MAPARPSLPRSEHLQALLLALLCSVLFLRDALLPGRALVPYPPEQMDVVRAEAIANGRFDAHDARRGLASGGDKYLQSLCWDRVLHDRLRRGEVPLWTRDIVGGAPFVPQMAQVYEPINLLLLLLPSEQWYGWWFLIHQVLFGWFAYGFLRKLGCEHASALLGLVAAVLGLWTQCKLHHNVILTAALPLWPMLSLVDDLVRGQLQGSPRKRAVGWLALATGISWLSGFAVVSLQVTYLAIGWALLRVLQRPRGERLRRLLPVAIGMAIGGLLSFAHMIPVLQASAVSAREAAWNPAFLAAHGLEWDHALTALWPDLLSWPCDQFYPDPKNPLADITRMPLSQIVLLAAPRSPVTGGAFQSWVETSFAVGTAPLACAALALFDRGRRAIVVFFGVAGLLAFGIATADEPFLSLARFVPGIGSADLRRTLFTVAMALVVLTGLGADGVLRAARRWPALLLLGLGAAMSVTAIGWLWEHGDEASFLYGTAELYVADVHHPDVQAIGGSVAEVVKFVRKEQGEGEVLHNLAMVTVTAWRALLVAGLAAAALLVRRRTAQFAALIGVTMLELLHAGFGPVQTVPAARVATPPAVVAPVFAAAESNGVRPRLGHLAARLDARVASWYPGNLPGYHGLEDATGYNPLPSRRFEEFFTAIEPDCHELEIRKTDVAFGGAGVGAFHDPASLRHPLCDLFGIRFVVTQLDVPLGPGLVDRTPPGTGGFRLLERTTTLPRATFVREVDLIADRDRRLLTLRQDDRDVAHRIVLEDTTSRKPSPRPSTKPAEVAITEHRDERVVIQVDTDADGYLRLADPYDAGWRATVDGTATEVYVADHYLRAVWVKPGKHEVVFTFDGARVLWPRHVSLLALAAIAALLCGLPRRRA